MQSMLGITVQRGSMGYRGTEELINFLYVYNINLQHNEQVITRPFICCRQLLLPEVRGKVK